ncbi:MAG: DUF2157 domain-containing protein [Saprospiraceae bacterium]
MAHPRYIRWLYEELPDLVSRGIINQEQATHIRAHYGGVEAKPAINIGFLVASILGALLVGSGIILIFAYNWEDLSHTARTILSFAPVISAQILFGYAYFYRHGDLAWTEGTSAFLMLMLAASIALVSQTYHIWGEPETFLWNWLLLSVPLIYLLNSSLVSIIYLIGITSWTMQVRGSDSVWYWFLLALVIPHFIYNWRRKIQIVRRYALGWALALTFIFGWFGTIETHLAEFSLLGTMLIISGFYALGRIIYPNRTQSFITRPFQTFAVITGFIYLLILTYDDIKVPDFEPDSLILGHYYAYWAGITNIVILILIIGAYIYLLLHHFQKRNIVDHFATLLPFFGFLVIIIHRLDNQEFGILLANVYLLAWGIFYLINGIQERRMPWVNIGMFFILALVTVRFFDTNWSPLVKGVIFILLGIGFLASNIILSRRLKLKSS